MLLTNRNRDSLFLELLQTRGYCASKLLKYMLVYRPSISIKQQVLELDNLHYTRVLGVYFHLQGDNSVLKELITKFKRSTPYFVQLLPALTKHGVLTSIEELLHITQHKYEWGREHHLDYTKALVNLGETQRAYDYLTKNLQTYSNYPTLIKTVYDVARKLDKCTELMLYSKRRAAKLSNMHTQLEYYISRDQEHHDTYQQQLHTLYRAPDQEKEYSTYLIKQLCSRDYELDNQFNVFKRLLVQQDTGFLELLDRLNVNSCCMGSSYA